MMAMATWRPTADMEAWLEGRAERSMTPGGLSARTRTEMVLWRATLDAELRRQRLNLPELGMIADVCNGTIWPDAIGLTLGMVAADVSDAIAADPDVWGEKWDVDEDQVLAKLLALGPAADHALADALARWWSDPESQHSLKGWAKVGVHVEVGS